MVVTTKNVGTKRALSRLYTKNIGKIFFNLVCLFSGIPMKKELSKKAENTSGIRSIALFLAMLIVSVMIVVLLIRV